MIKCEELGQMMISGSEAEILAEYAFITTALTKVGALERKDIISAFSAGLFKQEIDNSGKSYKECWDKIDELINEAFGKEVE